MRLARLALAALLAAPLGACVMGYHEENAALVAPHPLPPTPALAAYAAPNDDYPTVGGDVLKDATKYETPPSR